MLIIIIVEFAVVPGLADSSAPNNNSTCGLAFVANSVLYRERSEKPAKKGIT